MTKFVRDFDDFSILYDGILGFCWGTGCSNYIKMLVFVVRISCCPVFMSMYLHGLIHCNFLYLSLQVLFGR